MHICYVLGTFPTTSETFISDEIIKAIEAGHSVTIARTYQGNAANHVNVEWIERNVEIIDIKPPLNSIETIKLLARACAERKSLNPLHALLTHKPRWSVTSMLPTYLHLHEKKVDHIHAHFADKQVLFAHALSTLMQVPFSFTMHGYDIRDLPIGKDYLLKVIKASKCAFTTSTASLAELKKIGANIDSFNSIPCGINATHFTESAREFTGGMLTIACVARLHPVKNHQTLLNALANTSQDVEFKLKIIGDGTLMNELKNCVNSTPRLKGNVIFLGALSNEQVRAELLQSHVHVLPSLSEGGLPVANSEAMATGLICIGSSVGGIPEAIQHGQNGFLFNPNNAEQLTNIIADIYFQRIDLEKITRAARSDALSKLDQEKLLTQKLLKMSDTEIQ